MVVLLAAVWAAGCGGDSDPSPDTRAPASPGNAPPTGSPQTPGDNGGTEPVGPLEVGIWGGAGATLAVQPNGAQFRYGCVSGQVPRRIVLDQNSAFDVSGTINIAVAGPDGPSSSSQARYRGKVEGELMSLRVTYVGPQGDPIEYSETLTYGFEGPLPPICPL